MKTEIIADMIEGFIEPVYYDKKKGVNFTERNKEYFGDRFFEIVHGYVSMFFDKPTLTITSAEDSTHSTYSMHYDGKAIDFRIKDWVTKYLGVKVGSEQWAHSVSECWYAIAQKFPNYCFIVHVYSGNYHVHCQHSRNNLKSPFGGLGKHHNIFIK